MPSRETEPSRVYFDHHLDSARWQYVPYRRADIVVATGAKVGTTWTQRILAELLAVPAEEARHASLWVDARFQPTPVAEIAAMAAGQTRRRFFKSHLPFDALPYDPAVKYIAVGRDGRDVALSLFNHYCGYAANMYIMLNSPPGTFADEFPKAPSDPHSFIKEWLTRGNRRFPWEKDGYPFWSHFTQIQSFWDQRDLPNVLLIHYQDMKADLQGEARRIALFLDVEPTEALLDAVAQRCTFDAMKREAMRPEEHQARSFVWEGGSERFFNKGVSGRWRDVFTSEELALYKTVVESRLSPACARWLEQGRLASGIDPSNT